MSALIAVLATAFAVNVLGMPWSQPPATGNPTLPDGTGWTPKPTEAPELRKRTRDEIFDPLGLFKRLNGYGDICGYDYSDADLPVGCGVGFTCVSSYNRADGYVLGCCPISSTNCMIPTTCLPFGSTIPTSSAPSAGATLYCTNFAQGNCIRHQIHLESVARNHKTSSYSYPMLACGPSQKVKSMDAYQGTLPLSTVFPLASSLFSVHVASFRPGPPVVPDYSASFITPTPSPTKTPNPSPTPIGPIVGGVVGGVAVIAIIIGFIIFFMRKKRKSQRVADSSASVPAAVGSAVPPSDQPPMSYAQPTYQTQQPVSPATYDPRSSQWSGSASNPAPYSPPPQTYQSFGEGYNKPGSAGPIPAPGPESYPYEMSANSPTMTRRPGEQVHEMNSSPSQQNAPVSELGVRHPTSDVSEMPSGRT